MSTIVENIETMNIKKYKRKKNCLKYQNQKCLKKKVKVSKIFSMKP